MNRRFYRRCLLWLLPFLVAHSLVPVGFMVSAGQHGLELGFCPVQSAAVVAMLDDAKASGHAANHSAHAEHHGHSDGAAQDVSNHSQHARSVSCPFALTGAPLLSAPVASIVLAFVQSTRSPPPDVAAPPSAVVVDLHRIRGPPSHA